jgi:polar amino acid transport system permease protein/polar amino acid transport system substrate-binding protein
VGDWFSRILDDFIQNFITESRYTLIIQGFTVTVYVSFLAAALGVIIGTALAFASMSKYKALKLPARGYIDIIRGTPAVTQLLIIYFVVFGSVRWHPAVIGAISFGINSGAYVAEIIRAGILSVDYGQTEAGLSLGMTRAQTMIKIVLPQAVKNIFPALCNEFIVLIKETAIIGYVGIMDLAKAGEFIRSRTFSAFMPLLGTAIIYFIVIKLLTKMFAAFEKKLRKSDIR